MKMASTMQLEFSQAMSDFEIMFPDMDRDVIEAVLRANQGAVDATIDQLLQMSTDNQNEKLRNELDSKFSPQKSLINLSDNDAPETKIKPLSTAQLIDVCDEVDDNGTKGQTAISEKCVPMASPLLNLNTSSANHNTGASPKVRPPQLENKTASQSSSTPKRASRLNQASNRWNPPMLLPLPSGFLRLNPINTAGSTIALPYDPNRDFELPDEQFAMMLQNEEFMNQLRWNQEFINALEKEQSTKVKCGEGDADFKERVKHMGKVSRKKFLQMARVFTWQRNKKTTTAKQIDSLPLKEEPSDDEENHHQHSKVVHTEQTHAQSQQRK